MTAGADMAAVGTVLLVANGYELLRPTVDVLYRAGCHVDVLTQLRCLRRSRKIRNYIVSDSLSQQLQTLRQKIRDPYNFVAVLDESTLRAIQASDLTIEEKQQCLPVTRADHFGHLCSKIGLSQALQAQGIRTPEFRVARDAAHLIECAEAIGYPLLFKIDFSSGGNGVFECVTRAQVLARAAADLSYPLLVQKKIFGRILDLSGFYQHGELIHFSYAVFEKTSAPFGASSVRTYSQLGIVDTEIFDELRYLGRVLGVHGFSNITCIESQDDGQRYYFEADLRPNVWVDSAKFIGNDPAAAIRQYYATRQTLQYPQPINPRYPQQRLVPYFFRLDFWEVIRNRYKIWRFMRLSQFVYLFVIRMPLRMYSLCRRGCSALLSPVVPVRYNRWIAQHYGRFTRQCREWLVNTWQP